MYQELLIIVLVSLLVIGFIVFLGLGAQKEIFVLSIILSILVGSLFIAIQFNIDENETIVVQAAATE